jgi:UDPglucose 6-dehydrogenase
VIGTNYVGLVTAACLAQLGHSVIGIDIDPLKVARLRRGVLPIHEPGLEAIVVAQLAAARLRFTLDYSVSLRSAQFAFVCMGTPPSVDGSARPRQVRAAVASLARHTPAGAMLVVVNKSTLPVGTSDWMQNALEAQAEQADVRFAVVSNPEFLREGSAVSDFLHPDHIVLGGDDAWAVDHVSALYDRLLPPPPIVRTDRRTAEMTGTPAMPFWQPGSASSTRASAVRQRRTNDKADKANDGRAACLHFSARNRVGELV